MWGGSVYENFILFQYLVGRLLFSDLFCSLCYFSLVLREAPVCDKGDKHKYDIISRKLMKNHSLICSAKIIHFHLDFRDVIY